MVFCIFVIPHFWDHFFILLELVPPMYLPKPGDGMLLQFFDLNLVGFLGWSSTKAHTTILIHKPMKNSVSVN